MDKKFNYEVNGTPYPVNITFKRMRNIRYFFKNGEFYVSCPRLTSMRSIIGGLDKFAEKMVEKANKKVPASGDDYIYLYGYRVEIGSSGTLNIGSQSLTFKSRQELDKKLKKFFKEIVTQRVRYYEKLMNIPEYNVRVQKMSTRYGSNSKQTHTVNFSTVLMNYSLPIIDSVVVHELAHHFYFDHSENFYNVVYKYCPNYKKYHSFLRKGIYHD